MRVLIFDDDELRHSEYDRIRPTDGKDVAFKIVPLEDDKLPKFVIIQSVNRGTFAMKNIIEKCGVEVVWRPFFTTNNCGAV